MTNFVIRHKLKNAALFSCVFVAVAGVFAFGVFRNSSEPVQVGGRVSNLAAENDEQRPLFVAMTSYSFIADLMKQIGGGFVDVRVVGKPVTQLRQGIAGITGTQYSELLEADAFFILDERADAWAQQMLQNEDTSIIRLRDGLLPVLDEESTFTAKRNPIQEYYWLSPTAMKHVVKFIARQYGAIDSVHAVQYLDRAYDLAYQMQELGAQYNESFAGRKIKTVSPIGLGYAPLFDEYAFKLGTTFPDDASMIAKTVEAVRKRLTTNTSEYVLADVSFPAGSLYDTASLRNRIVLLDPFGNLFTGSTYVDFLDENMRKLTDN